MIPTDRMERMDFFMDLRIKEAEQRKTVQLLYLIAAGIVLLPFEMVSTMFPAYPAIGYFMAEKYMAVPCLLFFGSALTQRLSPSAKRSLLLSALAVLWFVVVQTQRYLTGVGLRHFGIFAVAYLLAFPYAAVTEDGRENRGLKWIGRIYVAISLLMTLFVGMLLLDVLPEILSASIMWDGARALIFWHPNGSSCVLMLGIGFSLYLLVQTEKKWEKWILLILTVLEFGALFLTNSRTSIFLTSAMAGGTVFFMIWKGSWKQFLAGAAAALAVILALVLLQSSVFKFHTKMQINKLVSQQAASAASESQTASPAEETILEVEVPRQSAPEQKPGDQKIHIDEQTGEITLSGAGYSGQGELSKDIKHLNGRTSIWKAAFSSLRDNPSFLIWGTENVAAEISYRNSFYAVNAHNAWIQTLMLLGVPGFLVAVVYTVIAVWNLWILMWRKNEDMGKKIVAMMVVCLLVASVMETYLFVGEVYTNFANFVFFLCTGYLIQWNRIASGKA